MEIEANIAEHDYCIAVPCYDGHLRSNTCLSLLDTSARLHERNIKHSFLVIRGGALIHNVRNELTHQFLGGKWDTMICIDADMQWEWDAFERLITFSHLYPIVAGVYCARHDPPRFFMNCENEMEGFNEHGLLTSKGTGMGFVAITRKAFEQVSAPTYHNPHYPDSPMKAYFQCGIRENRAIGEDIWFFEEAWKAGVPTMIDPGINLIHHGHKAYDYKFSDSFIEHYTT